MDVQSAVSGIPFLLSFAGDIKTDDDAVADYTRALQDPRKAYIYPPKEPMSEVPEWPRLEWPSDFLVPQACDGETEVQRRRGLSRAGLLCLGCTLSVPSHLGLPVSPSVPHWGRAALGRLSDLPGPLRRQLSVAFSSMSLTSSPFSRLLLVYL